LPTSHPQTAAISTLITIAESAFSEAHAPIHAPAPLSHTTATLPDAHCWVLKAITAPCLGSETKVLGRSEAPFFWQSCPKKLNQMKTLFKLDFFMRKFKSEEQFVLYSIFSGNRK
jgi:hypothetical protein